MHHQEIYQQVAEELGIPEETVTLAYKSKWRFIRNHIETLTLKEPIDAGQFKQMRTNFNLPSLGKLYLTFERFLNVKKRYEYLKNLSTK